LGYTWIDSCTAKFYGLTMFKKKVYPLIEWNCILKNFMASKKVKLPLKRWVLILDIKYVGSSCDSWSMMGVSIFSINIYIYIYIILIKIDQNWINIFHSIFPRDLPF